MSGYGLFGDGATAVLETDDWRGHGLAIAPVGRGEGGGRYVLAGASRRIGNVWAGLEVGDLSDGLFGGRFSRTVSADVLAPTPLVDARMQIGRRETNFGTGLAWLMNLSRVTDDWSAGLTLGRSPGGGAAFARTEQEFSAEGSARVSPRVLLGGGLWSNADGAAAGRPFRSSGWNSQSGIRIDERTNVNIELRHNRWSSDNALGDITNENTQLGGTVSSVLGRWQLRVGARGGEVVRSTEIAGIGLARISAPQVSLHGGAMLILQAATLSADATREVANAGVRLPSNQTSVTLRADRMPV
jgi:hypothetical protein